MRPATLSDRPTIHGWSYASDVAALLHLSDAPTRPLHDWADDWEAHDFIDGSLERGRRFVVLEGGDPVGAIAYGVSTSTLGVLMISENLTSQQAPKRCRARPRRPVPRA